MLKLRINACNIPMAHKCSVVIAHGCFACNISNLLLGYSTDAMPFVGITKHFAKAFKAHSCWSRGAIQMHSLHARLVTAHGSSRNAWLQICIKWGLQHGTSVIPKATSKDHVLGNLDVLDWELKSEDYEVVLVLNL